VNRQEAAKQLNINSEALRQAYFRYGVLSSTQTKQRADSMKRELMSGGSVSGADRRADIDTVDVASELPRVLAEIKSCEEYRDHLRFMIKHGLEGSDGI